MREKQQQLKAYADSLKTDSGISHSVIRGLDITG